ncbi:acyltransferase-like protein At1g54570, chloroplastic isoform X1 [Selaginella moellendorffii]|uniref:acyltransferase-like protein At1g54570, chloroplastic isoform X1 n=2 Tax=Selaginella moellendorffii TaxID=88036 RepID=UPI000D1CC9A3|nr:acyltransferase-like protein At1g54570, chloroplastic isoform X1 [Selaginella moellendorffii]|eukprot:XP_024533756.1 acyltransferase-like protein At1g54570, chloroplastic isoform X1 [Selaginella moellendorffii]
MGVDITSSALLFPSHLYKPRYVSSSRRKRSASSTMKKRALVFIASASTELQSAATQNGSLVDDLAAVPSCPTPDFSRGVGTHVTLLNPLKVLVPPSARVPHRRSLLVYVPGMDCTGQGIRPQLPSLVAAGHDIRCVYIPSSNRSGWSSLTATLAPLLRHEAKGYEQVILVGESFGGRLALHLARAADDVVSRLVLVNPSTNLAQSNKLASIVGHTGILALFPEPLYEFAQNILLPLMVKRNRVSSTDDDLLSPIDFVPAECAAFRLSMLNDQAELSDGELRSIQMPTLILSSAKDRMLASLAEGIRLQSLIPNSKRVILPDSGHMALLEDCIDLAEIMDDHGFHHPNASHDQPNNAVPDETMDQLGDILGPWRFLTSPFISGADNLPSPSLLRGRPVLFVGNHTIFGVYDSAVLVHELFLRGFKCRTLAHPGHWMSAVGTFFEKYGCVKANKFEAYRVLKEGQHVLLFPGGAREVCKRKQGEEYKLFWKPTTDFVRMAIRLNAIIVPFGALGGDEAFKVFMDSNDILQSPLSNVVRQVYTALNLDIESVHPISTFPFTNLPSAIPFPYYLKRIYFHFAEPVDTSRVDFDIGDREKCRELYMLMKERVEKSINLLKQVREDDPERELQERMVARLKRVLPATRRRASSSLV